MQLHQLNRPKNLKKPMQRVGRGQGSGRGKQSGKGGKGQTARAGAKIRPAWRDIIKKLPKRRGFGKNRSRTVVYKGTPLSITLTVLEKNFTDGAEVTISSLAERGIVNPRKDRAIKIVGGVSDSFGKKLAVKGIPTSASARAAVEKAGGSVA